MWVLDSDGDVLGGRSVWLCPGKSYLFGRTKSDPGPDHQNIVISNKSVSRKHLTITVSPVEPGSGTNAYSRSKVILADDSKIGTALNGQSFCKATKTLGKASEHLIQLGSFPQLLRIKWRKVGFSFCYTIKQSEREDVLAPFRKKLEPLDIKTYLDYIVDETEFLVSNKRNIPKGLQALINGRAIVKEEYVNLVVAAATSPGVAEDGSYLPSELEKDFDKLWPDSRPFIPDPGKEPIPRPPEAYHPNPDRISIFEGLSFVFGDEGQYSALMPAITNGGAKCLLRPIKVYETSASEFVDYMKGVANKKGGRSSHTDVNLDNDRNVIFVRINRKGSDDDKEWIVHFIRDVDAQLGQESIEQNEFLDAILQNNAGQLVRPIAKQAAEILTHDVPIPPRTRARTQRQIDVDPPPSTAPVNSLQKQRQDDTETELPRKARRLVAQSRFKGFDDFDALQIPKAQRPVDVDDDDSESRPRTRSRAEVDASQSLFVSDSAPENKGSSGSIPAVRAKRGRPASIDQGDHYNTRAVDVLVPNANALKKRRLQNPRANSEPREESEEPYAAQQTHPRVERELDVRAHAQSHAKELDTRSRSAMKRNGNNEPSRRGRGVAEEMIETEEYDGITPEEMHRLQALTIEEFDLPDIPSENNRRKALHASHDNRWNPLWNGRKNFKGFKRARDRNGSDRSREVLPQTFIAMVDAKAKNFGVGQGYLDEDEEDEDLTILSRREREEEYERNREGDNAMMDSDIEILESQSGPPRTSTSQSTSQRQSSASHRRGRSTGTTTSASPNTTRTSKTSKRQASRSSDTVPAPKRTRQARVQARKQAEESEEEEDEMRFRRKRR